MNGGLVNWKEAALFLELPGNVPIFRLAFLVRANKLFSTFALPSSTVGI
jgi:hypothetical protein